MPITSRDDFLCYWDAILGREAQVGGRPTLSRASKAFIHPNRRNLLESVANEFHRTSWVTIGGRRLPALLLEMARTSISRASEDLSDATWTKDRCTITADAIVAPDGALTADKIVEDTSTGLHRIFDGNIGMTDGAKAAGSFFAKAGGRDWIQYQHGAGGGNNTEVWFNLANGTIGTTAAAGNGVLEDFGIESFGGGWYRCFSVASFGAGVTSWTPQFRMGDADNSDSYTGDGSSGVYLWGFQAEDQAAFPTSYIGATTTADVTRAVESMQWSGAPDPQAMAIYLDCVLVDPLTTDFARFWQLGEGATAPLMTLQANSTDGELRFVFNNNVDAAKVYTIALTSPAVGDRLQAVSVLNADGSTRTVISHAGAAVQSGSSTAPASGLPSAWVTGDVLLNEQDPGTRVNAAKYRQFKIVKPDNLDSALDGTADQALLDEMEAAVLNQDDTVRRAA